MDDLQGGSSLEATISVVLIMKEFEVLRLGSELKIAPEPLGAKKSFVVRIVEAFNGSISPRFSEGDKNHFDPER